MSQNTELTKIKLKIKALASKTVEAGCSENEANIAMQMVGQLLSQYNLTMDECDVRESKCRTLKIPTGRKQKSPINWVVMSLADLFCAKVWYNRHSDVEYSFFGQEQDMEMIEYLYKVIDSAIQAETEAFKNSPHYRYANKKKTASSSFGHGMADRISERLRDLRKQNDAELKVAREAEAEAQENGEVSEAPKTRGTALIVLKKQLVDKEFDEQHGFKLRNSYSQRRTSSAIAYSHGVVAGNRVNLSRPLDGGNKVSGYLK